MANKEKERDPYDGLRPWSAITHAVGIALALCAAPFLLARAADSGIRGARVAVLVYLISLIGLYTASTLYHSLRTSPERRLTLRKVDHLNIYYLIAGSYTPFCVITLSGVWGTTLLIVVWSLALIGTALKLIWIHLPRWLTSSIYLIMGWIVVFAFYPLSQRLAWEGMVWLVLGGLSYTTGGVLYAVKWPCKHNPRFGCHEIFHVFILLGSIAQFAAIWHTFS